MPFPVIHSVLSPQALQKSLETNYTLESIQSIEYFQAGLNDTYLITTVGKNYILRAYRKDWRSESDILCEISAINFLHDKQIYVSTPIRNTDNNYILSVDAPEGQRYVVIYNYIKGEPPTYKCKAEHEAQIYGKAFGQLHAAWKTFISPHPRFELNLDYLLLSPLKSIKPFLKHRPSDWEYLFQLANILLQAIEQLPEDKLSKGFCHGDLNSQNVHFEKNTIGLFDFDCSGYGYHAADIAAFRWGARLNNNEDIIWPVFLAAYVNEHKLSDIDIQAIPIFTKIRHIWHMGLHVQLSEERGTHWINDAYFDAQFSLLKKW